MIESPLDVTPKSAPVSATRTPEAASVQVSVEASAARQAPGSGLMRSSARRPKQMTELEGVTSPAKISPAVLAELVILCPPALACGRGAAGRTGSGLRDSRPEPLDKSPGGTGGRASPRHARAGALPKDPSPLRLGVVADRG